MKFETFSSHLLAVDLERAGESQPWSSYVPLAVLVQHRDNGRTGDACQVLVPGSLVTAGARMQKHIHSQYRVSS